MKKLILIFSVFMCCSAWADDGFYTADAQKIVDSSTRLAESLRGEYAELEKQILAIDPGFAAVVSKNKYLTDEQKITMARSYLAQKTFDSYRDAFMAELEQRSKETGRKIVTKNYDDVANTNKWRIYQLDRGELDEPKCHLNNDVSDWRICFYPDGFEDFWIDIREFDTNDKYGVNSLFGNNFYSKVIYYNRDIPDKNAVENCKIALQYDSTNWNIGLSEGLYLTTFCTVKKYDEHHAWRNQEIEDIKNGKYEVSGWEDYGALFGKVATLKIDGYKSNYLPDAYVIGRTSTYSNSVQKTTK